METALYKRPLMISATLAAMLLVSGWYIGALLFAPLALLAAVWQILRALYHLLRRQWPALRLCGLRLVIWLIVLMSLIVTHDFYLKRTQAGADAIVAALQSYHVRDGHYPADLSALVPRDISIVPVVTLKPNDKQQFRYWVPEKSADKFTLTFYSGFHMSHTYDSTISRWELRD